MSVRAIDPNRDVRERWQVNRSLPSMGSLRSALALVLLLITLNSASGQRTIDTSGYAKHTVFVSLLGEGLHYSLNYERRWPVGRSWMALSAGLTYVNKPSWHLYAEDGWTASWNSYPVPERRISGALFSLPLRWSWFSGRTHHREHGIGLSFAHAWWAEPGRDGYEADLVSTALCVSIKPIGYRFQKRRGGLYAKIYPLLFIKAVEFNSAWTEYLKDHNASGQPLNIWIGLDVGYTFRSKR